MRTTLQRYRRRFATVAVAAVALLTMVAVAPAIADGPGETFDYTITATGTETVDVYPDPSIPQSFEWEVVTSGEEVWYPTSDASYSVGGEYGIDQVRYKIITAPAGTYFTEVIDVADCQFPNWCWEEYGNYISTTVHATVAYVYYNTGHRMVCGFGCVPASSTWTGTITMGLRDASPTVTPLTAVESGSGELHADDGTVQLATLGVPAPEHGGSVHVTGRTLTCDNPLITCRLDGNHLYASTEWGNTTIPWSATETGSTTVSGPGDTVIATSTLVAPNGDTTWTIEDSSDRVDTWMVGNVAWALLLNSPPTANDDAATTNEDTAVTIDVAADDTDPDGDALTVSLGLAPEHGTAAVNPDGTVTYTPDPDWNGVDAFEYLIQDPSGESDVGLVTVTVLPVNDPPVAVDDAATTDEDTPIIIDVLANDSAGPPDEDQELGVYLGGAPVGGPIHGTIELNPDDTVTYTPDADFHGTDTFAYNVTEPGLIGPWAIVTVTVLPVNDPPVADDQAVSTDEDTPVDIQLTGSDIDGSVAMIAIAVAPGHGTLGPPSLSLPITYTPEANWYGTDMFAFTVTDDGGLTSEPAIVTITVLPVNDPPVADADGPYSGFEGSPITLDGSGSWDLEDDPGMGDITMYEWDLDNDGQYDDAVGVTVDHAFGDNGEYTVGLKVTDSFGDIDSATSTVTVANVAPTVATPTVAPSPAEGVPLAVSATFSDPGANDGPFTCEVQYGDGSSPVAGIVAGTTCTGPAHAYADDATYTILVTVTDKDGGMGSNTVSVDVANAAPDLEVAPATQTVQYSDGIVAVTITASDVSADPPTLTTSSLPGSMAITDDGCTADAGFTTCTWTLSGIMDEPAGSYTVQVTVDDEDGGVTTADIAIVVVPEDARIAFDDDNPVAVQVADPGGDSGAFTLRFDVSEVVPDLPAALAAAGDIGLAEVSMILEPVGPGSPVTGACTKGTVAGAGYDAVLPVTCDFDGVPVNAYVAMVTIGGDYYTGGPFEDVVVVYDPSLGFTTGGGWFLWPGTGEKVTFGYTMSYNKKATNVKGNLVLLRHLPDGTIYRVKSNALYGLALGEDDGFGWATFSGKATYQDPTMIEPEGNHEFIIYVEDWNEPGSGNDQVWVEVHDKDGNVIDEISMPRPADENTVPVGGGNIVAPH
jgi:hypothetical protein